MLWRCGTQDTDTNIFRRSNCCYFSWDVLKMSMVILYYNFIQYDIQGHGVTDPW